MARKRKADPESDVTNGQRKVQKPLTKSPGQKIERGIHSQEYFIDLSDESEATVQPKTFMRALPPDSKIERFPRFNGGGIYIIIDPDSQKYQYRLHKPTIWRLCPLLAKVSVVTICEPDESLKCERTSAHIRVDLQYSSIERKWIFQRNPFTSWESFSLSAKESGFQSITAGSTASGGLQSTVSLSFPRIADNLTVDDGVVPARISTGSSISTAEVKIKDTGRKESEPNDKNSTHGASFFENERGSEILATATPLESLGLFKKDGEYTSVKFEQMTPESLISSPKISSLILEPENGISPLDTSFPDRLVVMGEDVGFMAEKNTNHIPEEVKIQEPTKSKDEVEQQTFVMVRDGRQTESINEESVHATLLSREIGGAVGSPPTPDTGDINVTVTEVQDEVPQLQNSNQSHESIIPTRPSLELCEAYNNIFGIFYNIVPAISSSSVALALKQCENTVSAAKTLGSLAVIRPFLGNALGQLGKQLFVTVSEEPFRWLKLAVDLESTTIFKESVIHIVGKGIPYVDHGAENLLDIPLSVRELLNAKAKQLYQKKLEVNETLLLSSIMDGPSNIGSLSAGTARFPTWFAVQIWRDWLSHQLTSCRINPSSCMNTYRILAKSGNAYLEPEDVRLEMEKTIGSIRGSEPSDFEELKEDLSLIKNFAKVTVAELFVNNSVLSVDEMGIDYFTCTTIEKEELPWFKDVDTVI